MQELHGIFNQRIILPWKLLIQRDDGIVRERENTPFFSHFVHIPIFTFQIRKKLSFDFHKFFSSLATLGQNNKLEGRKGNKREKNIGRRKEVEKTGWANPIKLKHIIYNMYFSLSSYCIKISGANRKQSRVTLFSSSFNN
jgi:hypothetical protein